MNDHVSDFVRKCYDLDAGVYRNDSDPAVLAHQGVMEHNKDLSGICLGFKKKIDVLDLCCGTGRYFHALKNVNSLVGVDFSAEMLKQARSPIQQDQLDIKSIQLICADVQNITTVVKPDVKFDLVYSIGALGEYTPLGLDLLNSIYGLLSDGGRVYLTTVKRPDTFKVKWMGILRRCREMAGFMDRNLVFTKYALNDRELSALLKNSRFKDHKIKVVMHNTHAHNVIIATKGGLNES